MCAAITNLISSITAGSAAKHGMDKTRCSSGLRCMSIILKMQWEAEQCAEDGGGSGIMYLCSDLVIYVWNGKYKSYSEKHIICAD